MRVDSDTGNYYYSAQSDAGLDLTSQGEAEVMLLSREVPSSERFDTRTALSILVS